MTDTLKQVTIIHGPGDSESTEVTYLIREKNVYLAGIMWVHHVLAFSAVEEICRVEEIQRDDYTFYAIWNIAADPRLLTFRWYLYLVDRMTFDEDEDDDSSFHGLTTVAGKERNDYTTKPPWGKLPPLPEDLEIIFTDYLALDEPASPEEEYHG